MKQPIDHRPLAGIRVLAMSRVFSGPWAMQQIGRSDDLRPLGPPFLPDAEDQPTVKSSYYLSANRNKRPIAVDITCEEQLAVGMRVQIAWPDEGMHKPLSFWFELETAALNDSSRQGTTP